MRSKGCSRQQWTLLCAEHESARHSTHVPAAGSGAAGAELAGRGRGSLPPGVGAAFEKARAYYSLLTLPPDALIKAAAEKPKRFTSSEYMALLQVLVTCSAVYQDALPAGMAVGLWSVDLTRQREA